MHTVVDLPDLDDTVLDLVPGMRSPWTRPA